MHIQDLIGKPLTDIILTGEIVVRDGVGEFLSSTEAYFFVIADHTLRCKADPKDLSLAMEPIPELTYPDNPFEDTIPGWSSIGPTVLLDIWQDTRIAKITLHGARQWDSLPWVANAISLFLQNGQELFMDGYSTLGMNLGGAEQRALWMENNGRIPGYETTALDFE